MAAVNMAKGMAKHPAMPVIVSSTVSVGLCRIILQNIGTSTLNDHIATTPDAISDEMAITWHIGFP